jgi:hypothetical protein
VLEATQLPRALAEAEGLKEAREQGRSGRALAPAVQRAVRFEDGHDALDA